MAKLNAKLAVDNSDLWQLDGLQPNSSPSMLVNSKQVIYNNNKLTIKVFTDFEQNNLQYVVKTDVARSKANKLFKGDGWESKFFKGADIIKGSSEADSLYGYNGKDKIFGNAGDDLIYGGKGADTLYGGEGGDTLYGGAGKDFLDGGEGVNFLTGGGGKDVFSFSAALMGGNYSQIEDFKPGQDKIQLDGSVFKGAGKKGALKADKFFLESDYNGKAGAVIYDEASGNLKFSKDGGDIGDAIVFGRIGNGADLSAKDFLIA